MGDVWTRVEIEGDENAPFTVMFEPTGMTYAIAGGDRMFADILAPILNDPDSGAPIIHIVNWRGGVSIWAPGAVVTRDANGLELHTLS